MLRYVILGAALGLVACTSADGGEGDNGKQAGGDVRPCPNSETSPVDWDEMSDLGLTPAEAFAAVAGSCQANFDWDASGAEVDVTPRDGSAEISVELTIDHDSVVLRRFDSGNAMQIDDSCKPVLEARAAVHVSTDDGVFDISDAIDIAFRKQGGVSLAPLSVDIADHEGSLSVPLAKNQSAQLQLRLAGAAPERCVGQLLLNVNSSEGNKGMSSQGPIGAWSSTGCGLQEVPIALDDPFDGSDSSLRELILASFADLQMPGSWDDGTETELSVQVEVPGKTVCREDSTIGATLVPVRVTYATQDGAIAEHTTDQASVRAPSLNREGEPLELWISEALSCNRASDTIPYTLADCETLASVELQLGINDTGGHLESGEGLRAYETHREGSGQGGADEVRVLTLVLDE